MPEDNGWSEYQKLVIHRLDNLDIRVNRIETKLHKMDNSITGLRWHARATAAVFGAVAGFVPLLLSWMFRNS